MYTCCNFMFVCFLCLSFLLSLLGAEWVCVCCFFSTVCPFGTYIVLTGGRMLSCLAGGRHRFELWQIVIASHGPTHFHVKTKIRLLAFPLCRFIFAKLTLRCDDDQTNSPKSSTPANFRLRHTHLPYTLQQNERSTKQFIWFDPFPFPF